ncbi:hypothetical protein NQZ68_017038, partial [Dissostichus eleginoides]
MDRAAVRSIPATGQGETMAPAMTGEESRPDGRGPPASSEIIEKWFERASGSDGTVVGGDAASRSTVSAEVAQVPALSDASQGKVVAESKMHSTSQWPVTEREWRRNYRANKAFLPPM